MPLDKAPLFYAGLLATSLFHWNRETSPTTGLAPNGDTRLKMCLMRDRFVPTIVVGRTHEVARLGGESATVEETSGETLEETRTAMGDFVDLMIQTALCPSADNSVVVGQVIKTFRDGSALQKQKRRLWAPAYCAAGSSLWKASVDVDAWKEVDIIHLECHESSWQGTKDKIDACKNRFQPELKSQGKVLAITAGLATTADSAIAVDDTKLFMTELYNYACKSENHVKYLSWLSTGDGGTSDLFLLSETDSPETLTAIGQHWTDLAAGKAVPAK